MLAVVKTPHIELSINGSGAQEALEWLGRKYSIHVITDETKGDSVDIGETAFYREMELNRVGNLLEAGRLKNNLTQKQLADAVGIRQTMVSEYETGKRHFGKKMAARFADVLHIKAERLL